MVRTGMWLNFVFVCFLVAGWYGYGYEWRGCLFGTRAQWVGRG